MSKLISQLFQSAQSNPARTAFEFKDTTITTGAFADAVMRLAAGLLELGIQKGDRVAILLPNVPHFCISYYAIMAAGAIVVPLNFMHDSKELEHQLCSSDAKVLIVWQEFLPQVQPAYNAAVNCTQMLILGDRLFNQGQSLTQIISRSTPLEKIADIQESDIAVINYTSGITDEAMGAFFTHNALAFSAKTCVELFQISPQEKLVAVLPLFHPLGQTLVMHASLVAGAPIVILPRFRPNEVIEIIRDKKVTILPAVPGMFRALNEVEGDDIATPSLKFGMSYGGILPEEILFEFESKFDVILLKSYGLTEAGPLVSATRPTRDRKPESSGLPLIGTEVQIRDNSGKVLQPNQSGEIFVKSPGLMNGYWNQPNESARRLQDGWLATGDIGYLDFDHYLFIQERKDDIIIKGGFAVNSREVEDVILDHQAVVEVAVVGIPDHMHGSEVKAYVVLKESAQLSEKELYAYCKEYLPVYKCPRFMETVTTLPKSPTGRVLKRILRQLT